MRGSGVLLTWSRWYRHRLFTKRAYLRVVGEAVRALTRSRVRELENCFSRMSAPAMVLMTMQRGRLQSLGAVSEILIMRTCFSRIITVSLVALTVATTGCYSVTSRPDGGFKVASKPDFEQRQDFYLWGLVGESHIDTRSVCAHSKPTQMQSQMTFVDGLLSVVTLGIYSPQSARVWCK